MIVEKRLLIKFLVFTFTITYFIWGSIIVANRFDLLGFDTPFGLFIFLCGVLVPAAVSYACLKKSKKIHSPKDFIKTAFSLKERPVYYLLVFILLAVLCIPSLVFADPDTKTADMAWFLGFLIFPQMIIGGGLEELGWRYLLQPTLEKHFSFFIASSITAVIWWSWHIPSFFIEGTGQGEMPTALYAIAVLGLSFSLATIYRTSKNIWLCIMFHALVNTLSSYWPLITNLTATIISAVCAILISILIVNVNRKNHGSD